MSLGYFDSRIQSSKSDAEKSYWKYRKQCLASTTQFKRTRLSFLVAFLMVNSK